MTDTDAYSDIGGAALPDDPGARPASWLDEFWSVAIAIPALLAFVPGAQDFVSRGFVILSKDAPGWYVTALGGAMAWAFGRRAFPHLAEALQRPKV